MIHNKRPRLVSSAQDKIYFLLKVICYTQLNVLPNHTCCDWTLKKYSKEMKSN